MKPDGSLLYDTTESSAVSTPAAETCLAKAGYDTLATLAADAYAASVRGEAFDMSVVAGHEAHYYRTHQRYQVDFRAVLDEMSRRHCRMPYAASKYERAHTCGDQLVFAMGGKSESATLALAFRCGLPLCPCCEASRSHKRLLELSDALAYLQTQRAAAGKAPLVVLMLTETLPNCTGADLSAYIDLLFDAHNRFMHYKAVSDVVLGTARSFEITHKREDDYHPHLHTLLLVEPSYFNNKTASRGYLSQRDWANLHYKAVKASCKRCGVAWSDIQQPEGQTFAVYIERAYKRGSDTAEPLRSAFTSAGLEATKYVCKPDEIIRFRCLAGLSKDKRAKNKCSRKCACTDCKDAVLDMDWSCEAVETIGVAIKGRRRYTSSGLWREALTACGFDAEVAPDDDIGQAVRVPREERQPDASGVAYAVISQYYDHVGRDYLVDCAFTSGSPDDDGPLSGGRLAAMAERNMVRRARRDAARKAREAGPQHIEKVNGKWIVTGLESALPPDHGVTVLPDDVLTPFDADAAPDSGSESVSDTAEQLHF